MATDEPRPGDVEISYCVTDGLEEHARSTAIRYLSEDERRRHDGFRFERDRRDYALAHAVLRRALARHCPQAGGAIIFVTAASGKPAIAPSGGAASSVEFNLTHTHGLVACALAHRAPVGIDAECVEPARDAIDLARHYFSPMEVAALERCSEADRPERFTEIWTLKEAYVKAIGDGLSCPLDGFGFTFDVAGAIEFHFVGGDDRVRRERARRWRFALFAPTPQHRIAIAVHEPSQRGSMCVRQFHRIDTESQPLPARPLRASRLQGA